MGDFTTGYFSSHKLSINDLDSLQSKPEQFDANLWLCWQRLLVGVRYTAYTTV